MLFRLAFTGSQAFGTTDEQGGKVKFGFTIKPDMPVERIVALTRQAEAAGFDYGWVFDSHVLWLEPYPFSPRLARTRRTCASAPVLPIRALGNLPVPATLFPRRILISHGRMHL